MYYTQKMEKKKQNKSEFKVECTIITFGHVKKCYPFVGSKKECWIYIYSIGVDMFTTIRRKSNLQHFYHLSRLDGMGLIYMTIERCENYRQRIKLNYKIVTNN